MTTPQTFLRQRSTNGNPKESAPAEVPEDLATRSRRDEIVWGKTPGGDVFRVPTTYDVLTALFHPSYPKSHLDLLNLGLLGLQLVLFFFLPRNVAKAFFLVYFAFWRAAYDAGLGWVLTKQSKKKWIVREVQRLGWLDEKRCPGVRDWIRDQLRGKMGKDYSFDELPLEYNTWLLFRQAVDVILINDFLAYCMFAFTCFRVPEGLSITVHVMRWIGGIALILFNLWVKTEAHNVVKDYGWYWGDVFFQRGALVFDGVFELAPHPMYSVGYAGYYGLSLISGSYAVLFASLAAHAAQFAFLVFFENPHIERMYGQRKPIARRTPLFPSSRSSGSSNKPDAACTLPPSSLSALAIKINTNFDSNGNVVTSDPEYTSTIVPCPEPLRDAYHHDSTPAATEGDTATETDLDTETEMECPGSGTRSANSGVGSALARARLGLGGTGTGMGSANGSVTSLVSGNGNGNGSGSAGGRKKRISQHDLLNKYFRRDAVILLNIDIFRANDLMLVLLLTYTLLFAFLPLSKMGKETTLVLHTAHALVWCVFHCFGLGWLLKRQSESKFLVRHFMKNYHYEHASDGKGNGREKEKGRGNGAIVEAFANWKVAYNLSLCMTYVSFISVVWKTYSIPNDWTVGNELLRHTLGVILVGLHVWATMESFEVLGVFGWFFGDFFMEEFPAHLEYTGIYRYLNNPEVMGGAAWFGGALISGSKLVLSLAVIRHLSHWWFLSYVENPHMRKLYGDSLRKDAGFVKVIKSVASKNARLLESRAERHAPELKRVAKEVKGTFDKVYEETAEVVEEFLAKSRPKISEVVQDTKVLLQQSRERLIITRIANDISAYDTAKYKLSIVPNTEDGSLRFHLGEPISLKWQAPFMHSRRDWIGIYRVGANKSNLVTKTSSFGMWVPVYDEEWDGDVPLGLKRPITPLRELEHGVVALKGDALPWSVGRYEIRYHHDGKYNVMSLDGPIEIYVDKPSTLDFTSVRETLMHIVPLCLDSDPSLIPLSCNPPLTPTPNSISSDPEEHEDRDPDDFSFWSERQAKRICGAIKQAFDVEYAPEVVVADANLSALANRILLSKEILTA